MAMMNKARKSSQPVAKPMIMQPAQPTARQAVKTGFLKPLVSAMAPRAGPVSATRRVTKEAA